MKTEPDGGCKSPHVCTTLNSAQSRDVYYGYDLTGLQTAARFDSASGRDAVTITYDWFSTYLPGHSVTNVTKLIS